MALGLVRQTISSIIGRSIRRHCRAFDEATKQPRASQDQVLERIVKGHLDTGFGHDHGFGSIRNARDFRRLVPVAPYEYLEPYINRVASGDYGALLKDRSVHMFAVTSGTTAARKLIPVTSSYVEDYKRGWNVWGLKAYADHPECALRPIVQLAGNWQEFHTAGGIPCGSVSGLTAAVQKRIVRFLYCVPASVSCIKDPVAKNYLVLRLSLPRDVGTIVTANPSTLINLARAGDQDKEHLLRDLYDGTLSRHVEIPETIRQSLAKMIRKRHRRRAAELEQIVRRTGHLYPGDYWNQGCIVGTWTGGSMSLYLRMFPRYFGDAYIRDIGLLASEGRMTIPVDDCTPSGVLDITSHYFEFMPESEAVSKHPLTVSAEEVEEGRNYFILPTTAYGLYRYHICDLVRVTGFYNRTPLVEFLNKGAYFANLTGEKLSEHHVTGAMRDVLAALNQTLTTYGVAPCWNEDLPYYGLFIERGELSSPQHGLRLATALDRRLRQLNVEYDCKRASSRLGPIRLNIVANGAWHQWDVQRLKRSGGAWEQYKHPFLLPDPSFANSIVVEDELTPSQMVQETQDSASELALGER